MYHSNDNRPILPVCFCIHRDITMGTTRTITDPAVLELPLVREGLLGDLNPDASGKPGSADLSRLQLVTPGIRSFVEQGLRPGSSFIPDVALLHFTSVSDWSLKFRVPNSPDEIPLLPEGDTTECGLSNALKEALDAIEARTAMYRTQGRRFLKPILVVVSAGEENSNTNVAEVAERVRETIRQGALTAVLYATRKDTGKVVSVLRAAAPGAIVESVDMVRLPEVLKNTGKYIVHDDPSRPEPHRDPNARPSSRRDPQPAEPEKTPSAAPYILGVFTDVE